jgi:hypothetical protein
MDFESVSNVLFSEPMFVNDFTILTVFKGVAYESRCVKSVMINNSTTIKNAIDIEDSSTFSVPIEINPTAFKKILQKLHTPKYLWHNILMGDDKNVQHMLIICNWFGITQLYAEIIKNYENLLSPTDWKKYTPKMFENVDDELYRFIDLEPPTKLVPISEPCVVPSVNPVVPANPFGSLSRFGCSYLEHNPIKSLFTGDKLGDTELVDFSLTVFDKDEFDFEVHRFIKKHCMRETTREKIDEMLFKHKKSLLSEKKTLKTKLESFETPDAKRLRF